MTGIVSFGSTYKVSNGENKNFAKFQRLCLEKKSGGNVDIDFQDKMSSEFPYKYSVVYTMVAPDSMDGEIETFCANNGIKFTKLNSKELLSPESINNRIETPLDGYKKVYINAKKFEKIVKNQSSNFEHCENDYNKYYKKNVNSMLMKGDKFPATSLFITANGASCEDTVDYIKKFGPDNLNEKQISLDFNQRTNDPDHCVYFALKAAGIENIPVYVDDETYKIADTLGIIER